MAQNREKVHTRQGEYRTVIMTPANYKTEAAEIWPCPFCIFRREGLMQMCELVTSKTQL